MRWFALTAVVALLAPGATQAEAPAAPQGLATDATEVIRQRDDNGRVRVQREVRLNDAGDYVNHGAWRSWDAEGQLVGQGRYAWGKPTGAWTRWADRADSPLLSTEPFVHFEAPFLSQSTQIDGKLEGPWTVFDADGRRVSEVNFRNGQRDGVTTLWTAEGSVYRRSRFEAGAPVGDLEELGDDGQLRVTATFEAGRHRYVRETTHPDGQRRSREELLGPVTEAATADDPWRLSLARYEARGEPLRDGRREEWWPNGQPKLSASYRLGEAVGEARWWHANGQLASHGSYEGGLADGRWVWWRESGVRAASVRFAAGQPAGEWSRWAADGTRVTTDPLTPLGPLERLARRPGGVTR